VLAKPARDDEAPTRRIWRPPRRRLPPPRILDEPTTRRLIPTVDPSTASTETIRTNDVKPPDRR